ncbi:hypothetical protein C4K14_4190 [Pseudomonas chlororaphis subsp. aureofaciens]|uniref:class I SAM-dependent methyltransferase n=1 Tax=Pseudomonas chlororaphis TaxID=587753 RepID=UPI000F565C36|nr:methyltransferase domain-containing protein [Pseudomonas chlororaphis]AZD87011.1 hypothetical protein C4K14_4190 [Pseudomonas chlororaphis subsp. aureofaciens]
MEIPYSIRLSFFDFWKGLFKGTLFIQKRLRGHLKEQQKNWPKKQQYSQGYFYQGLEELGITGLKPTGFRFKQYAIDEELKGADVLDIGSNCGFVSVYCSRLAKSVTAVELNPFLNKVAKDTARYLKRDNIEFIESDFSVFATDKKFDVVLSFSNHHTIDGNLNMGFENYMKRLVSFLKPGGYLLFESHNVFGPGSGAVGDDGDMDEKIKIMNTYFVIERYRMVNCYMRHMIDDVDKLFIVARLVDNPPKTDFRLEQAIRRYHY